MNLSNIVFRERRFGSRTPSSSLDGLTLFQAMGRSPGLSRGQRRFVEQTLEAAIEGRPPPILIRMRRTRTTGKAITPRR